MAIPEGYTPLAKIGIVDKGEYVQGTTYSQLDAVYYDGSTFLALIDNPVGFPTNDKVNWRYLARGTHAQQIENYNDLMANTVSGYLPDALAVKEGFEEVNSNLESLQYNIGGVNENPIGITRSGKDVYSTFKTVGFSANSTWTDIDLTDVLPSDIYLAWIDVANSFLYADGVTYPINFKSGDKFVSVYLHNTQRKAVAFNSWVSGNLHLCIRYTK